MGRISLALVLLALPLAATAEPEEKVTSERIEALETRIEELEAGEAEPAGTLGNWTRRVKLGGSANTGYYWGQSNSVFRDDSFQIWDARIFIDAELGNAARFGETTVLRNVGFSFEWNLVRLGHLENEVGELIVDFQGIADSSWFNLQVGRFQIPVGENYLRFSQGYSTNPFISNTVGGPWFWDEGVRFYGNDSESRFGYVASLADAENAFNLDQKGDFQYTLKLFANPTSWLHLSVSALYTGEMGSSTTAAEGSLWLGEAWARAFGSGSIVPNYVDGVAVPDGPKEIRETYLVGADAIVTLSDIGRLWLAYGIYDIDQGTRLYNRRLHYWIAEILLYGSLVSPELADLYLGFRANGLGTYDSGEGYLLDFRFASTIGYNMESLTAYSTVLGWRISQFVTLRAEYTHQDMDLVRGVSAAVRDAARELDSWAIEVGVHF